MDCIALSRTACPAQRSCRAGKHVLTSVSEVLGAFAIRGDKTFGELGLMAIYRQVMRRHILHIALPAQPTGIIPTGSYQVPSRLPWITGPPDVSPSFRRPAPPSFCVAKPAPYNPTAAAAFLRNSGPTSMYLRS